MVQKKARLRNNTRCSYWDILAPITECADGTKGKWILSKGGREIMVGSASDRILYSKTVNL